ncbi:MAG: hypothetical protein HQL21_07115 [Candidatus Omnitrophica bacterium]|nr:hypothetical protein [Candidatus Omnitrophota bacterium]
MRKICVLILSLSFFAGYGYAKDAVPPKAQAPQADEAFVLTNKLLARMVLTYQNYLKDMFSMNIAQDAPLRDEFIDQVDRNVNAGKVLELNYFINQALFDGGKKTLSARFNWEKRVQPQGGGEAVLSKGEAEAVFKQQTDGEWLLYQISGDNPF